MKFKGIIPTVFAIAFGGVVLLGYFFPQIILIANLQRIFLNWAVILAGFAVLVGISNLVGVHINKVRRQQKGRFYSALLVIALLITFTLGLIFGPAGQIMVDIFKAVQLPVEASLMALLTVTLTYASLRLLQRRMDLASIVFLGTALLILFSTLPLPLIGNSTFYSSTILPFFTRVLAVGGARGILIGVGLGMLTAGLRILTGTDRPYGGNK